jgi:hypothetical protein
MSIGEKITSDEIEDAMQRLFAGRDPSEKQLARRATLKAWRLRVHPIGNGRRQIVIHGTLASGRFTIKDQPRMPAVVMWMDRKWRFVVTPIGLWNLGEQERAVDDMNLKLPVEGKADE